MSQDRLTAERNTRLGVQLFTMPVMAANDLDETLKLIATTGFGAVEFFGPLQAHAR